MNRKQLRQQVFNTIPTLDLATMGKDGQRIASSLVDATLDHIIVATLEGEIVRIDGFGTFEAIAREPHLVYCNLSQSPGYKVTKPYVRVYLRPCSAWKDLLAEQVKDRYGDRVEKLEALAQEKNQQREGGDHGEVRVSTRDCA